MQPDYDMLPSHMREGTRRYIEEGVEPGQFTVAVFANDFLGAAGRADENNSMVLRAWALFIYNEVPGNCHGSYDKVAAWIKQGGLQRAGAER